MFLGVEEEARSPSFFPIPAAMLLGKIKEQMLLFPSLPLPSRILSLVQLASLWIRGYLKRRLGVPKVTGAIAFPNWGHSSCPVSILEEGARLKAFDRLAQMPFVLSDHRSPSCRGVELSHRDGKGYYGVSLRDGKGYYGAPGDIYGFCGWRHLCQAGFLLRSP